VLLRDPSLHQDLVRLVGSHLGSRRMQAGWDTLARLRTEVEGKVAGMALGPAGRENLVEGRELVDMESVQERGLRSLAEEGIDFDSPPVVVRS